MIETRITCDCCGAEIKSTKDNLIVFTASLAAPEEEEPNVLCIAPMHIKEDLEDSLSAAQSVIDVCGKKHIPYITDVFLRDGHLKCIFPPHKGEKEY